LEVEMKRILEALDNAQGWAREAVRRLEDRGTAKEVIKKAKRAIRLLEQVDSDLFFLLTQQEEIRKLLLDR
jgi:transcriptional regulator